MTLYKCHNSGQARASPEYKSNIVNSLYLCMVHAQYASALYPIYYNDLAQHADHGAESVNVVH